MEATPDTNGITIVTDDSEKKEFIRFPYNHYNDDEYWVPPLLMEQKKLLNPDKNPFFNNAEIALFLAEKNGRPAGRIAAIIDHRFNEYHDTKAGFFGFFECIDSQTTVDLMVRVVADWMRDRGMKKILGPANPSMVDEVGILIDGFDKYPYIMMPYHKPYYDRLLNNAGLSKAIDMYAFEVNQDTVNRERMQRAVDIVRKRMPNLKIRKVRLKKIKEELKIIRHIFNEAWKDNWGFIPLSSEEFDTLASDLKKIVNTDFAHIAEIDGEPVAFSVAFPDYNQVFRHMNGKLFPIGIFKFLYHKRNINRIRTALMGVLPKYRGKGIDALLHQKAISNGLHSGFYASELSWVLESNVEMIRVAERIGAEKTKTYRMYEMAL